MNMVEEMPFPDQRRRFKKKTFTQLVPTKLGKSGGGSYAEFAAESRKETGCFGSAQSLRGAKRRGNLVKGLFTAKFALRLGSGQAKLRKVLLRSSFFDLCSGFF
jgi:hypothetical protein